MSAPLVSIVIPAFNAARWLCETLDSAFGQTWRSLEVILVDDGSTDETPRIARSYERHGLRIVTQVNRGLSGARNAGLAVARGDFIQFLDADDLLSPDKIEAQVAMLRDGPPGTLAIGRAARFRLDPSRARLLISPFCRDFPPLDYLRLVTSTGDSVPVHAWLLPRRVVDHIGPFAEELRVFEDQEYFTRAALAATSIRFCEVGMSYYRSFHAHTLSKQRDRAAAQAMLRGADLVAERLLADGQTPPLRRMAANYYQRFVFRLYPDHPDLLRAAEERIKALGGADARLAMGRQAQALARVFGWKPVQRMRSWLWNRGIYLSKHEFIAD